MSTYFAIVTCRNSEKDIEMAINSLANQSLKPRYIIIIDDGSKDGTPSILNNLKNRIDNIYIITNPDYGYDVRRIVTNWNKALKFAEDMNLEKTDYHMIATDDTQYEVQYAEKILNYFSSNNSVAIASGNYDKVTYSAPHGAGRLVNNAFFSAHLKYYPEKMGYESAVLYEALEYGFKCMVVPDARFIHTRQLGSNHHFYEFGASMRTLGYHPIFAVGRFLQYFLLGKPIGRIGAINMLYYYLSYKPKQVGYDSMYDSVTRKAIRNIQKRRIAQKFRLLREDTKS